MKRLALLFLAPALLGADAELNRHQWEDRVSIRTKHFLVESNTSREIALSLATRLEASYPLFENRFGPLRAGKSAPMRLLLYRTRDEYMQLGDGIQGAVGHFDAAADRCALIWMGELGESGWPIAVHEASHHYIRRCQPYFVPPSWYGEGIACYFEGLQDPRSPKGIARNRARIARAALENGDADLSLLLETQARVKNGTLKLTNFSPMRYYALSWSFVHYLATNAETRAGFRRFEMRLFAARPALHERERLARSLLIEEVGGLDRLEKGWRAHLRAMKQVEPLRAASVAPWELEADRAHTRLAALKRLRGGPVPAELRGRVLDLLLDPDVMVRAAAAELIEQDMDKDAVPGLLRALDSGDSKLRDIAFRALAHRDATDAVPRLLAERENRPAAIAALAVIADARAFPTLRDALLDRTLPAITRTKCAAALSGQRESIGELRVASWETDRALRETAEASLKSARAEREKMRPRPHVDPADLKSSDSHRAHLAALTLGPEAGPEAVKVLLELVSGKTLSPAVRVRACRLLAAGGVATAVPALKRLCVPRENERVRLAAIRALVKITGEARGFEPGQQATAREAAFRAWVG